MIPMYISVQQALACTKEQPIHLRGWVDWIRSVGKIFFVILREKHHKIQLVMDRDMWAELAKESVIEITWMLIPNESVKMWWVEVRVESLDVVSAPIEPLPLDRSHADTYPWLDMRLTHRHISLREPKMSLWFQIQSFCDYKLREFCDKEWIIEIHSPKLLGTPSESGAELFSLEYFGREAYLAQSPQFYKQMALAAWFEKVLEVWPAFRAEPSQTSRHATEFISTDFEFAYIWSHHDVMDFEERLILFLFGEVRERYGADILEHFWFELSVPSAWFPRITFADAVQILKSEYDVVIPEWEDISSQGEKLIAEYAMKTYGSEFVFLIDYPIQVRPFYHMRDESGMLTNSFDLLYRWLEITTGAQREHRYDILRQQAVEKMGDASSVEFYLDFFKHGMPSHGGLWFGWTRFFTKMLWYENIREMTLIPRDMKRLIP